MNNHFDDVGRFFSGNIIFNMVSLLVGTIGIVLSFYFYYKGKKDKKPIYVVRSINLIRENIKQIGAIEINYLGNKVENLSITKIAFWNNGKETINYDDTAKNNPLRVTICDSSEILEAEILYAKNQANGFYINIASNKKYVDIIFDYFDYEEGVVIKLAHTARSSSDISIVGTVKSVKSITRKRSLGYSSLSIGRKSLNKYIRKSLFFSGCFIVLSGIFIQLFYPLFILNFYINDPILVNLGFIFVGVLYIYLGKNTIKRNIPIGFDLFEEDF